MTAPARSEQQPKMVEVRCKDCGRLLFKANASSGRIEIVCPDRRCKRYQTHDLPGGR